MNKLITYHLTKLLEFQFLLEHSITEILNRGKVHAATEGNFPRQTSRHNRHHRRIWRHAGRNAGSPCTWIHSSSILFVQHLTRNNASQGYDNENALHVYFPGIRPRKNTEIDGFLILPSIDRICRKLAARFEYSFSIPPFASFDWKTLQRLKERHMSDYNVENFSW